MIHELIKKIWKIKQYENIYFYMIFVFLVIIANIFPLFYT